jgi:hypothetical protein
VTDLRKAARGRECLIRLPTVCNHNPETVVLCHVRLAGITGAGQKAPDILGAYGCSDCHAECDRRTQLLATEDVRRWFYEGVLRTIALLANERVLKW